MSTRIPVLLALIGGAMLLASCGGAASHGEPDTASQPSGAAPAAAPEADLTAAPDAAPGTGVSSILDELSEDAQSRLAPWQGDLDGMIERRMVRVLTVFNPMLYFLDGPQQRGVVYEAMTEFEKTLNKRLQRSRLRVEVIIIPLSRDRLVPALLEGRGDMIVANLTVTPERAELVDFTAPVLRDINEVVVTGPAAPKIERLQDLAGRELRLRRSSSYWASIEHLNATFRAEGRDPIRLEPASEWAEDHDLVEMVHSGNLPLTIVDSHKARFWAQFFDDLEVREDLAVRTGGEIAWAFRKASPKLAEELSAFVRRHRKGTLFGNVVYKRYLEDNEWVRNALDLDSKHRFREMEALFRKYAEMYELDWLLLTAQGFQESGLDNSRRSKAGARGVMQLTPIAAKEIGISNIQTLENNIHAGAKYLRHVMDTYFDEDEIDPLQRQLFGLAAYNAGPSRISRLRRQAEQKGLDPNRWFQNVEVLAARHVGFEPVRYVSNITKYYLTYRLEAQRARARSELARSEGSLRPASDARH